MLSLYGFGGAINTLNNGVPRPMAILMTNIGGFLFIIGIASILTLSVKKQESVDQVLRHIKQTTSSLKTKLIPENLQSIELINNNYIIRYSVDSCHKQVIYSTKDNQIVSIK
jgi:hypothetical protein